jgi:glucose/arabinose dehydrogenase
MRNHHAMLRTAVIITVLIVIAGIAIFVIFDSPPPPSADAESGIEERAAESPPPVSLRQVPGTFAQPLYVTAPPGDASRLFVVEKGGVIRVLKDGALLPAPFLDISSRVSSSGEQGLLSMAFDPRFSANRYFYVDYTNVRGDTRVVRYRVSRDDPDVADPASATILLRVRQPYANHNGGQLQFGPDDGLYVGMGDGGGGGDPQRRAQDPRTRLGKLLRLDVRVLPVRVRVYARGLRNPWRFSFDLETGALWIGDVGQNRREEINHLRPGRPAGANFGWNAYEGTHVYDRRTASRLAKSSLTWPVAQYDHSLGESVTGGYVYRGSAIPDLRGWYLFADFVSGRVWAKMGPRNAKQLLPGADGGVSQIASFGQDASGELYVVSLAGAVYKIVP